MAGLSVDANQSKQRRFRSRDYANMTGALLVGAGVAHIALGAIDMLKRIVRKGIGKIIYPIPFK